MKIRINTTVEPHELEVIESYKCSCVVSTKEVIPFLGTKVKVHVVLDDFDAGMVRSLKFASVSNAYTAMGNKHDNHSVHMQVMDVAEAKISCKITSTIVALLEEKASALTA
jgi:hypothetical protein